MTVYHPGFDNGGCNQDIDGRDPDDNISLISVAVTKMKLYLCYCFCDPGRDAFKSSA